MGGDRATDTATRDTMAAMPRRTMAAATAITTTTQVTMEATPRSPTRRRIMATAIAGWSGRHTPTTVGLDTTGPTTDIGIGEKARCKAVDDHDNIAELGGWGVRCTCRCVGRGK